MATQKTGPLGSIEMHVKPEMLDQDAALACNPQHTLQASVHMLSHGWHKLPEKPERALATTCQMCGVPCWADLDLLDQMVKKIGDGKTVAFICLLCMFYHVQDVRIIGQATAISKRTGESTTWTRGQHGQSE